MTETFDIFLKLHERRIHFQIHRLGVHSNWYDEFYTEGIVALWKAYQTYEEKKGAIGTYINFRIRYALIDHIRKKKRQEKLDEDIRWHGLTELTNGTRDRNTDIEIPDIPNIPIHDTSFWESIKGHLTSNQWKWVEYFIIADLTIQEIMEIENVSADAVKGWGRSVRKKLKTNTIRQILKDIIEST